MVDTEISYVCYMNKLILNKVLVGVLLFLAGCVSTHSGLTTLYIFSFPGEKGAGVNLGGVHEA